MTCDTWYGDDEGEVGRFVPLYVIVNGRTSPKNSGLDLATQVIALAAETKTLEPEYEAVVKHCCDWISVAELAANLGYPLAVTKVLVDVLIERGFLAVGMPAEETTVDLGLLETILVRLQDL